jgi:hypothetical protein
MPKHAIRLLALLALPLVLLAGCGTADPSLVRIHGTSASISKATLNEWMRAMAGGDYRQSIGVQGPVGLASEPANPSECADAARAIIPKTATGEPKLTSAQIAQTCAQLHQALKTQALSFLIAVQWAIAEGAEHGITISEAELKHEFESYRTKYPTTQALRRYLDERHWQVSTVLLQLKRNMIVRRLGERPSSNVNQAQTLSKLVARYKTMIARTRCQPGYVVPNCSQYHQPPKAPPAPDILLEQLTAGA